VEEGAWAKTPKRITQRTRDYELKPHGKWRYSSEGPYGTMLVVTNRRVWIFVRGISKVGQTSRITNDSAKYLSRDSFIIIGLAHPEEIRGAKMEAVHDARTRQMTKMSGDDIRLRRWLRGQR